MAAESPGRIAQLRAAFTLTRRNDPKMLPIVLGAALGIVAVFVVVGIVIGQVVLLPLVGVLLSLAVAMTLFGRRAQASALATVAGQPGAGAAVLQSLRGDWRVTPMVNYNRSQDLVHRVVGRPGVVLVGEGVASRTAGLISSEKRRVGRVVGPDVPIYDVMVGEADGQVSLRRLQSHFAKLPRNLKPAQVKAVDGRLKALGGPTMPLPKGPLPKGARIPRGKVR